MDRRFSAAPPKSRPYPPCSRKASCRPYVNSILTNGVSLHPPAQPAVRDTSACASHVSLFHLPVEAGAPLRRLVMLLRVSAHVRLPLKIQYALLLSSIRRPQYREPIRVSCVLRPWKSRLLAWP